MDDRRHQFIGTHAHCALIHKATEREAEAIHALGRQIPELSVTSGDFMTLDEVKRAIADKGGLFLVHDDCATTLVSTDLSLAPNIPSLGGFLYLRFEDADRPPNSACLVYLAAAPHLRVRGIAAELWAEAFAALRERGIDHVYAWANPTSRVIPFLERRGFRRGRECVWMDAQITWPPKEHSRSTERFNTEAIDNAALALVEVVQEAMSQRTSHEEVLAAARLAVASLLAARREDT